MQELSCQEKYPGKADINSAKFSRVNKIMENKRTLYSLLIEFLGSKTKMEYPELEVSIIQTNPLRITDDGKFFMELGSTCMNNKA